MHTSIFQGNIMDLSMNVLPELGIYNAFPSPRIALLANGVGLVGLQCSDHLHGTQKHRNPKDIGLPHSQCH